MVRQATRRNKELIEKGKLNLMLGPVKELAPALGAWIGVDLVKDVAVLEAAYNDA